MSSLFNVLANGAYGNTLPLYFASNLYKHCKRLLTDLVLLSYSRTAVESVCSLFNIFDWRACCCVDNRYCVAQHVCSATDGKNSKEQGNGRPFGHAQSTTGQTEERIDYSEGGERRRSRGRYGRLEFRCWALTAFTNFSLAPGFLFHSNSCKIVKFECHSCT